MTSFVHSVRDAIKWVTFEIGAGYYSRKLASGPEAEIRNEFVDWLNLSSSDHRMLSILDVGCGPGHVTRALARRGHLMTGIDRSPRLLGIAKRWTTRERMSICFKRASARKLPFKSSVFDGAFATGVIYFAENPLAILKSAVRVIRPGGFFASLDPHRSMTFSRVRSYAWQEGLSRRDTRKLLAWVVSAEMNQRFKEEELRALLTQAGLSHIQLERRMGGMVWFSRGIVDARFRSSRMDFSQSASASHAIHSAKRPEAERAVLKKVIL